jgi:hypothetical protein
MKQVWLTAHAPSMAEANRLMDVMMGKLAPWVPDEPPEQDHRVEQGVVLQVSYTVEDGQ